MSFKPPNIQFVGLPLEVRLEEAEYQLNRGLLLLENWVPPDKRAFVFAKVLRKVLSLNRARIRAQKNADGTPFAARAGHHAGADGQDRRPMLRGMLKTSNKRGRKLVAIKADQQGGVLKSLVPFAGIHQFGGNVSDARANRRQERHRQRKLAQVASGEKKISKSGRRFLTASLQCSKRQAQILRKQVGFRHLVLDGQKVAANVANLQKAFSAFEAGAIIRRWRIEHGGLPKKTGRTPPREILGLSPPEKKIMVEYFGQLLEKYRSK